MKYLCIYVLFACIHTYVYDMEWYSLLYDLVNRTRFIYHPTKSVWNKIKAFILDKFKIGDNIIEQHSEWKWNIELFVADREYICEVKVLLLPTIFITFFFFAFPSQIMWCGGFFLFANLGSFHQKFHIWIVYGAKGCEKCFFDLVFFLHWLWFRDLVCGKFFIWVL